MKRVLVVALAAGLIAGSLAGPAVAKKKKPKAKPQALTLYFHGPYASGELDYAETLANTLQGIPDGFQVMDSTEPSDPAPDSMFLTNYVVGPNTACSGNALFPTWEGDVIGKATGDLTVYLNALAHPASTVQVDVFADSLGGCDSSLGSTGYVPPVATAEVTLAPGAAENEIVFEDVNFEMALNMVIMVTPIDGAAANEPTSQARVLYDSSSYASRVEFLCTPTARASCTP